MSFTLAQELKPTCRSRSLKSKFFYKRDGQLHHGHPLRAISCSKCQSRLSNIRNNSFKRLLAWQGTEIMERNWSGGVLQSTHLYHTNWVKGERARSIRLHLNLNTFKLSKTTFQWQPSAQSAYSRPNHATYTPICEKYLNKRLRQYNDSVHQEDRPHEYSYKIQFYINRKSQ